MVHVWLWDLAGHALTEYEEGGEEENGPNEPQCAIGDTVSLQSLLKWSPVKEDRRRPITQGAPLLHPSLSSTNITTMSRRAAIVEEFDDDTDLPLPSKPLPNTGTRGPLLEAIDSDSDNDDDDEGAPELLRPQGQAGPASPAFKEREGRNVVTDITPYKKWTCVYPIYIDAKRSYGTGERRIARGKSVWWPLSKDIAEATNRLGLGTLHEANKSHPRDWENPGRVRVQWRKDGKLVNPAIKTKKQLLEMISFQIQLIKPDNIPKPPYTTTPSTQTTPPATQPSKSSTKGKQPASKTAGKTSTSTSSTHIQSTQQGQGKSGRRLPVPPEPLPPLSSRVSPYSPALVSGVLIETVKAGMSASEPGGGVPGAPGAGAGGAGMGGKGKRKVVRVRG
ncbi:signal recognition particle SRP19 subunit [Cristinia sonorae]|uniref:Signal recognition particle SRP19 subunit n=1 Tax=Cristinia sonorae TaxID=1940300 RepID=A0A8K0URI2_9AGAR|nr:signal recognition particle SRP19 subunit [Cristinia sonorae]